MKENTINIRTSEDDRATFQQAAENLSILTDEKPSISKAIREGARILAETDPNQPILFYVNRNALRELEGHLGDAKERLQGIYNEYLKALGSKPVTMKEIETWYGTARSNFMVANTELIKESILHKLYLVQRAKYPDLQFNLDNVILPDLDQLIEVCHNLIFVPIIEGREYMFWQCYAIVNDKVELVSEEVEKVKNSMFRKFAITAEERARLAVVKKLCAVMDTIKLSQPTAMNIPGFVVWDDEAGQYAAAEHYVKGFIQ